MRWLVFFGLLVTFAATAGQSIAFRFARLIPPLQQPWYFAPVGGIAVDTENFLYVVEEENSRVRKFTRAGQLVTSFDQPPGGNLDRPRDIAIDEAGSLFLTDRFNHRIVVYTKDGEYLREFGDFGSQPGQFDRPSGIAFAAGLIYVVDAGNHRVQVFEADGTLVRTLGGLGPGPADGQFDSPTDVSVAPSGRIYVGDGANNRIQYFAEDGTYVNQFGTQGGGSGEFERVVGVEVDTFGIVYAIDDSSRVQRFDPDGLFLAQIEMPEEEPPIFVPRGIAKASGGRIYVRDLYRISQFAPSGEFLDSWSSSGIGLGQFNFPLSIAANSAGQIFVADQNNNRVQRLDADGNPLDAFGSFGSGPLQFDRPSALAVNSLDQILVADRFNNRVQIVGPDLDLDRAFGVFGTGPGEFDGPSGVATDSDRNIYVSDGGNHRIQKFTEDGTFIRQWGSEGTGDGQFSIPTQLALDRNGDLFVADRGNNRIQKFDADGNHLLTFGSMGSGNGEFFFPESLGFDRNGFLFVADVVNNRYQAFTNTGEFIGKFEQPGSEPGQIARPGGIYFDDRQNVFMVGPRNNRLQRFSRVVQPPNTKVIIVAGGGPYAGNPLWNATQVNANFAYRTLVVRGFSKDTIQYLSPDLDLDIDQNGLADDVDAVPSAAGLEEAISSFAKDASNLLLYLVDHGGEDTFRLTEAETLAASTLSTWVDQWQAARPGSNVTVIYDACQSGSFMDDLRNPALDRVLITSARTDENAYFVSQGALSFSNRFWTGIFNGASVGEAFDAAAAAISASFPLQTPLLDADGDGVFNSAADRSAVMLRLIGSGELHTSGAPTLGPVSAPQIIASGSAATVSVENVADADGVARVWAVLRPPGYVPASPDNPVQDLPTFDLANLPGSDNYSTEFEGFTDAGTYQIALQAQDRIGNISVPALTAVTVDNPVRRRAVVVHGGAPSEPAFTSRQASADLAFSALAIQGYGADGISCGEAACDDIYYLTNAAVPGSDGAATLSNLEFALTTWGVDNVQDLTVYLTGPRPAGLLLNETETLTLAQLDTWLDAAQTQVPGVVTVVLDADSSQDIVTALAPSGAQTRYLISSTSSGETALSASRGEISFSQFFWAQVLNGARLRSSFSVARGALRSSQNAQLDSNGNQVGNDLTDGVGPQDYFIGSGVALAGDDPFVGALLVADPLLSDFEPVRVSQVTTTSQVDRLVLLVTRPGGAVVTQPLAAIADVYEERSYGLCGPAGDYTVAAYAVDREGNVSLPRTAVVTRPTPCQDFGFYSGFE